MRSVLVSGAADGIGLGISKRFAAAGDRVAMLDFDPEKLWRAAEELRESGAEVQELTGDVREGQAVEAAVRAVVEQAGRLDVAVSNAGVYPNRPVLEMDEAEWDRVLDTNLKGTFLFTRAAARQMVAQGEGGKICTIASGAHLLGRIGAAHYCASKAGLVLYSKVLAMELAEHRINVNVVSPGFTDVGDREGVSRRYRETISSTIPWRRTGRPTDIANAVYFVCSPEAEFITGAVLSVDGGTSAGRFHLGRSS